MLRLRHAQLAARRYASAAGAPAENVIELRQYTLHPSGVKQFLDLSAEHAEMRARLNPGFRGCVVPTVTQRLQPCLAPPLTGRAPRTGFSCATPAAC